MIYAFSLDLDQKPYKVLHESGIKDVAGSETVGEGDAIVVYDSAKLERKSENGYWFKGPPKDAALLIFTIEEDTVGGDGEEAADA